MYVAVIPNRGSPPAILLRESYREAGKTKNRTLANLSRWPAERIEQLRAVLRGDNRCPPPRRWESSARCRTGTCTPRSARRNNALEAQSQRRSLAFEREFDGPSGQRLG